MDVDDDCIYVSPQPQVRVAPDSTKRRPVARMHASRVSKARKSLKFRKKNTNTVSRLPPRPRRAIASNTAVGVPDWTVVSMGGKCPPFNDKAGWMHDPVNRRIYAYGGLAPGDDSDIPTSDFYVCDTTTMQWKNISVHGHIQQCFSFTFMLIVSYLEFFQVSKPLQSIFSRRSPSKGNSPAATPRTRVYNPHHR